VTVDDYLLAAWKRGAPNALTSRGFPRGFWPDVARVAVEMALGQPISILQTMATRGNDEGRSEAKLVKGLDLSKLEFRL
jgi:hypothetical protein